MSQEDFTLFYVVTCISLYNALIPTLVSVLLSLFIWENAVETSLKRQVSDLKEELGSVSMTDEFAKYSKIQRKLNKATGELNIKNQSHLIFHTKAKLILYVILYIILVLCYISVNWKYYHVPILTLSEDAVYPIGLVLGFPTGQTNCLSVFSWSFISGYVFRIFIKNIF